MLVIRITRWDAPITIGTDPPIKIYVTKHSACMAKVGIDAPHDCWVSRGQRGNKDVPHPECADERGRRKLAAAGEPGSRRVTYEAVT